MHRNTTSGNLKTPLFWIAEQVFAEDFPDVDQALREPDGLLAIGGDLHPARLLDAYRKGIFPWFNPGEPVLWWSPDPRCVLRPADIHISTSLRKLLRRQQYQVTFNLAFDQVIRLCARPRADRQGTWISEQMIVAYQALHRLGQAVSVECWHQNELVGGLYGVVIGKVYFGESMFSHKPNASKLCLVHLARHLAQKGFPLIDCQVYSAHLASLGATRIPRKEFINLLARYCAEPCIPDWPAESIWL
jgi:leucyl/phenylalanyl-tRNA--protein transferase